MKIKRKSFINTLKSNNKLTIEDLISKSVLNNNEAKKKLDKFKEIKKTVDREKLVEIINFKKKAKPKKSSKIKIKKIVLENLHNFF